MSVFGNIKTVVARRKLKMETKKLVRNRQFVNFCEAKNIGILYLLDSEETYRDVAAYVASLQEQQKKCEGYRPLLWRPSTFILYPQIKL